jgi:serine phosphatase RsbU (regulator of sigma subunit)
LRNLDADTVLLAVGDCTGHGVPGALMSMIGITLLDRLIQEGVTEPALILEQLHLGIRRALQQDGDTKTARTAWTSDCAASNARLAGSAFPARPFALTS